MKRILMLIAAVLFAMNLISCSGKLIDDMADNTYPVSTTLDEKVQIDSGTSKKEIVEYYCSIGHYTEQLAQEINTWNETLGNEKGIELRMTTRCNCPLTVKDHLDEGKAWDLIDGGSDLELVENGWIKNLEEIEHQSIRTLLENSRSNMIAGSSYLCGITVGIPKEASPIKLAVNLELFRKNGLELPKTFDDVILCSRVITENSNGTEFGWGGCIWDPYYSQLLLKGTMNALSCGFWDPNTEQYHFAQYEPVFQTLAQMYAEGLTLGFDSLTLDEMRQKFSEGCIAMVPAMGGDYAAYTRQFSVNFDYTFIDMPACDPKDETYPGVFTVSIGPSICAPQYDAASNARKRAIEEAWLFLNSDELNLRLYQKGCIVPVNQPDVEKTEPVDVENIELWKAFSDLDGYRISFAEPDSRLVIFGDSYEEVFASIVLGKECWDPELIEDLEERYNEAYKVAMK